MTAVLCDAIVFFIMNVTNSFGVILVVKLDFKALYLWAFWISINVFADEVEKRYLEHVNEVTAELNVLFIYLQLACLSEVSFFNLKN